MKRSTAAAAKFLLEFDTGVGKDGSQDADKEGQRAPTLSGESTFTTGSVSSWRGSL